MIPEKIHFDGLSNEQVAHARLKFGSNTLSVKKNNRTAALIREISTEPMVLLLMAASAIYFFTGEIADGIIMLCAIMLVSAISIYQNIKSEKAIQALKKNTQAKCTVLRSGGQKFEIPREDLVPGDYIICEEGDLIAADGVLVYSSDFSVNESILTGESASIQKRPDHTENRIYQGTLVVTGMAICLVDKTGDFTELGKLGKHIENTSTEQSPLQKQIQRFVKNMAWAGGAIFVLVWCIHFLQSHDFTGSLMQALTLAMSILPEEIPVAFTSFMAIGAWRLMQAGILVKNTMTVETLGSATVICTDKTGTLTENEMTFTHLYVHALKKEWEVNQSTSIPEADALIRASMFASEPVPFDPMEKSLHKIYGQNLPDPSEDVRHLFRLTQEYPLEGTPPMMTHVFENQAGAKIIAAKGAPEAILNVCALSEHEKKEITDIFTRNADQGFRVLGVAEITNLPDSLPEKQQDLHFTFLGLIMFHDPLKKNIPEVFQAFYDAGIEIKIITGDTAATARNIAIQSGLKNTDKVIEGAELQNLSDAELQDISEQYSIFARMYPEAKLRIIQALKFRGHIVAMTGDGVNDAPALKAAHIGIAMGNKGSETAREASALILVDEDLSKMVFAIAMGRRIYANLKKAIQYIISIHIPIILIIFIPLALGWIFPTIFSPVHVIILELIMGPTCSIIYEKEPMEKNAMLQKPRKLTQTFFNRNELGTSILQGLVITLGLLCTYQFAAAQAWSEDITRTMVFLNLITANIVLTFENRSYTASIVKTLRYDNILIWIIAGISILLCTACIYITPLSTFFEFSKLNPLQITLSISVGVLSVLWYEGVKLGKRVWG